MRRFPAFVLLALHPKFTLGLRQINYIPKNNVIIAPEMLVIPNIFCTFAPTFKK